MFKKTPNREKYRAVRSVHIPGKCSGSEIRHEIQDQTDEYFFNAEFDEIFCLSVDYFFPKNKDAGLVFLECKENTLP